MQRGGEAQKESKSSAKKKKKQNQQDEIQAVQVRLSLEQIPLIVATLICYERVKPCNRSEYTISFLIVVCTNS